MVLVVNLTRPRCRLLLASPGWAERAGRAGAVATLVLDSAPRSVVSGYGDVLLLSYHAMLTSKLKLFCSVKC